MSKPRMGSMIYLTAHPNCTELGIPHKVNKIIYAFVIPNQFYVEIIRN